MCELLGMSSRRPVRLTFSLQTLASHSIPPDRQSDGWGAVFYQGNDVALSREPIAASTRPLVVFLGQQGPSSSLAISHIRHATRGEITLANTQPFIREWAGRVHAFAHIVETGNESFRFRHSTATARSRIKAREESRRGKANGEEAF